MKTEGPGLEKQACSTLFHKYLFLCLHWIHVKALEIIGAEEVEDDEAAGAGHPKVFLSLHYGEVVMGIFHFQDF